MSQFGSTTFNLTSATSCRDTLRDQITAAINAESVTNETLLNILLGLVECSNQFNEGIATNDSFVTNLVFSGNTATLSRNNGLASIIATVDISSNSTVITINNTITGINTRLTTAESDISTLQTQITAALTTVAVGDSLTGNGTVGNPLAVKISADANNSASLGTDGGVYVSPSALNVVEYLADDDARLALVSPQQEIIYTVLDSANDGSDVRQSWTHNGTDWVELTEAVVSGGGSTVIYTNNGLMTKATGLGITFSLVSNTGTVNIPLGIFPEILRLNLSYAEINDEVFNLEIVDNNPNLNQSLATFFPYKVSVIERDNFAVDNLPDGAGSTYLYETGNVALAGRTKVEVVDIQEANNKIVYRFSNLGVNTKYSIVLSQ